MKKSKNEMNRENGLLEKAGHIEAIIHLDRDNIDGVKIRDKVYWVKDIELPEWAVEGVNVLIKYALGSKGGRYLKEIAQIKAPKTPGKDATPPENAPASPESESKPEDGFEKASAITEHARIGAVETAVENAVDLWERCWRKFTELHGQPETEGQWASVNSMFIYAQHEVNRLRR